MAVEMSENVCCNVPGTIMMGVSRRNIVNETSNKNILSKENSSSYLK